MSIRYILCIWMPLLYISATGQNIPDSLLTEELPEVTIAGSGKQVVNKRNALQLEVADSDYLRKHFSGNLIQSLNTLPGVQSMDIGSGFSKPVIRGLGFNRISFVENGIKQEGQQWGADHGLETDPFNAEQVVILKGPASLLYGSDAMGGVIEVKHNPLPPGNRFFGEGVVLAKSVNSSLGASVLLGLKYNKWYSKIRYTEQHFRDYRVPTDTILYLTYKMPVYNRRLKNTAGKERHVNFHSRYRNNRYQAVFNISNSYQKAGFFPGAHGIPDIDRLQDDGNSGNIDLPYSMANHFKTSLGQQYLFDKFTLEWDLGYQRNHREEWSLFHTHYDNQPAPVVNPNKELEFVLDTYNSTIRLRNMRSGKLEHSVGWDIQYQNNDISGYNFLLPAYERLSSGVSWMGNYTVSSALSFSGGIRYDYGRLNIHSFFDNYLQEYLLQRGYDEETASANALRSAKVDKDFGDISGSVGMIWEISDKYLFKANIGRSFRLPGANELASNGVHHGTFRHEQGDESLKSERGWQLDMSFSYHSGNVSVELSPFVSWFDNYIYLQPTGEWSVLPHAGQIYKYTGAEALFTGGEIAVNVALFRNLNYRLSGEYVYTYNFDRKTPLSFSPPASVRNAVEWHYKRINVGAEYHYIHKQDRIAQNEDATPGAHLFNLTAALDIPIGKTNAQLTLSCRNLFDRKYFNHLSFYRRVEIPEPGRNFQVLLRIPFHVELK